MFKEVPGMGEVTQYAQELQVKVAKHLLSYTHPIQFRSTLMRLVQQQKTRVTSSNVEQKSCAWSNKFNICAKADRFVHFQFSSVHCGVETCLLTQFLRSRLRQQSSRPIQNTCPCNCFACHVSDYMHLSLPVPCFSGIRTTLLYCALEWSCSEAALSKSLKNCL